MKESQQMLELLTFKITISWGPVFRELLPTVRLTLSSTWMDPTFSSCCRSHFLTCLHWSKAASTSAEHFTWTRQHWDTFLACRQTLVFDVSPVTSYRFWLIFKGINIFPSIFWCIKYFSCPCSRWSISCSRNLIHVNMHNMVLDNEVCDGCCDFRISSTSNLFTDSLTCQLFICDEHLEGMWCDAWTNFNTCFSHNFSP